MLIRSLLLLGAALAPALSATPVAAAPATGPLQVTSHVLVESKQRAADGTTRVALVPARRAVPGDRVVFALRYRNTGTQPLSDIVFDNPVPRGIAYRAPTADGPAPEVSVDGQRWGTLAQLAAGGAIGPDDVTHVRWRLSRPLLPGTGGEFSFQAVLK